MNAALHIVLILVLSLQPLSVSWGAEHGCSASGADPAALAPDLPDTAGRLASMAHDHESMDHADHAPVGATDHSDSGSVDCECCGGGCDSSSCATLCGASLGTGLALPVAIQVEPGLPLKSLAPRLQERVPLGHANRQLRPPIHA